VYWPYTEDPQEAIVTHHPDAEIWTGHGASAVRVGSLRPSFSVGRTLAASSFEYESAFVDAGWQISPELPLISGPVYTAENTSLAGAFADAAPDDWGRKLIRVAHERRRTSFPVERLGEFDYLLGVADHARIGALRLRVDGAWSSSDPGVANLHDLPRILDAARRIETDDATDDDIAYLNDVATSPGGARPKANVATERGQMAIAKLPHSKDGDVDVERWEGVALTIAAAAGLRTPEWFLIADQSDHAVLVSERFDRSETGERLAYLSGNTLLGIGEHDSGSRHTYEDFAGVIDAWSCAPTIDLHEMFGRIALTVLINNVDDHWRNHGFIRSAHGWRLSPMFDVNPSRRRGVVRSRPISARDDPRRRDLRNLLAVARTFRLTDDEARAIVSRVAEAASAWEAAAESMGVEHLRRAEFSDAFETDQLTWALAA
jgi:serine/threonine-protein kinase HipA